MSQECCLCKRPIAERNELCYLKIEGVTGFYHHLACGHRNGTGTDLIPEMQACIKKLREYVALIRVVEGT